jgi:hypothetical protein
MTPREAYSSTLREIAALVDARSWRDQQTARTTLQGAWYMAALGRQDKMPDLRRFMRNCFPPPQDSPEMLEEWRQWAKRSKKKYGVRYKKHKRPVVKMAPPPAVH